MKLKIFFVIGVVIPVYVSVATFSKPCSAKTAKSDRLANKPEPENQEKADGENKEFPQKLNDEQTGPHKTDMKSKLDEHSLRKRNNNSLFDAAPNF